MKGESVFKVGIILALIGLIGIIVGFLLHLMFPILGTWIALICFIALCVGLIPLLIALIMCAYE